MGKFDKDRHLKQLAIRYCLSQGWVPNLEVIVESDKDLGDTIENLTDLDVVGLDLSADGDLNRLIFDCKSSSKMSAINRAFWAAGVKEYCRCSRAFVILGKESLFNHRISALRMGVDLHSEQSLRFLGESSYPGFDNDFEYQSSFDNWMALQSVYESNKWTNSLYVAVRNQAPISLIPNKTFRRIVAETRNIRGHLDPGKSAHVAVFYDVLAASFICWIQMVRDLRRVFSPKMDQVAFETALRYYIWGGKEAYDLRKALKNKGLSESSDDGLFPAWTKLVKTAGILVQAPTGNFEAINLCRNLGLRELSNPDPDKDLQISETLMRVKSLRQVISSLSDYLVQATEVPSEFSDKVRSDLA